MTQHARLSASSASRWMNCTGSPDLCEGKVNPASRFAQEGTLAHAAAETALRLDAEVRCSDPDMADAVAVYVKYCKQLMSEADEYHIEKRVQLNNLYWDSKPPEPLFGTVDFGAAIGTTLHVVDYKHGKGVPVDAEDNAQTVYYGLGLFFALTKGNEKRFTDVELTIIQPRAPHKDGPVRTWYISVKELMAWGKALKGKINEIAENDTILVAGAWCRWCPSMGDCPEAHRKAVEGARLDFGAVPKTKPETLTDDDLTAVLDGMEYAQQWLTAIASEAQGRLERGGKLKGWKLVAKRAVRSWKDPTEALLWAKDKMTQTSHSEYTVMAPSKLLSPAQMEKALKILDIKIPGDLIQKKSSGTTLAPDEDQRPEVSAGAAVDFGIVAADEPSPNTKGTSQ